MSDDNDSSYSENSDSKEKPSSKKLSTSNEEEQQVCELFVKKNRDWSTATKQNIKASKDQYVRKPVGLNAELYRRNAGYRKKQQAKEIGKFDIPPDRPIPRKKDQWDIKRKFDEMRDKNRGLIL